MAPKAEDINTKPPATSSHPIKREPSGESLVGLQAQNLYLINYLHKLEFVYVQMQRKRRREAKQQRRQIAKILKSLQKYTTHEKIDEEFENGNKPNRLNRDLLEKYLSLVDTKTLDT